MLHHILHYAHCSFVQDIRPPTSHCKPQAKNLQYRIVVKCHGRLFGWNENKRWKYCRLEASSISLSHISSEFWQVRPRSYSKWYNLGILKTWIWNHLYFTSMLMWSSSLTRNCHKMWSSLIRRKETKCYGDMLGGLTSGVPLCNGYTVKSALWYKMR